jgi:4-hydroxy-3-methylbut-2-enyl diphosphate reductase
MMIAKELTDGHAMKKETIRVILAQPRGFCAGVERAIAIVEAALKQYGPPVYVRHEIVHNQRVVENLKAKGVRFVEEIEQVPDGTITVFSAHGVSRKVEKDASVRNLIPIDATCPLVTKVHKEGQRYAKRGYDVVLIGHENHPEVEGTMGQIPGTVYLVSDVQDVEKLKVNDPEKVAYVTQTTLSVDDTRDVITALRKRFPNIAGPDIRDICYASQNRQSAARELAAQVDLVLVVGAHNSSNSNRLREVSIDSGVSSYLVEEPSQIDPKWLQGNKVVGITAGASTPEELVHGVIEKLREYVDLEISTMDGIVENVHFSLPVSLDQTAPAGQ